MMHLSPEVIAKIQTVQHIEVAARLHSEADGGLILTINGKDELTLSLEETVVALALYKEKLALALGYLLLGGLNADLQTQIDARG